MLCFHGKPCICSLSDIHARTPFRRDYISQKHIKRFSHFRTDVNYSCNISRKTLSNRCHSPFASCWHECFMPSRRTGLPEALASVIDVIDLSVVWWPLKAFMPSRKAITPLYANSSNPPVWSASYPREITVWTAWLCFATREAVISNCSLSS
jgi:hypothetical protein